MLVGHCICSQLPAEASALTYLVGFHMPYYYESVGYISWFKKILFYRCYTYLGKKMLFESKDALWKVKYSCEKGKEIY